MDTILVFLAVVAGVGVFGLLHGKVALWFENLREQTLAELPCPRCGTLIGTEEANAAYDRALQFARDHTYARVSSSDYSSARVHCRHCQAELIYWIATRSLHLK
jgi:hypothetical protein